MSTEYALLCLENPLLDILVNGNEDLLKKYDLKPNDAILAEEKHKEIYNDLSSNYDAKYVAGGAAQNTARGAQYLLPAKSTVYIGCIGDDEYGRRLKTNCEEAGVHTEYLVDPSVPTGTCAVVITGHHRSMCTELGAANHYKITHLESEPVWKLVESSKIIYVGGYHLTVCVPAILALAEHAAKENKPFVMNISAPFVAQFFKDQLDSTSKYWDYIIGNETEAVTYADAHELGTKDIKEIAKHLANLPKENGARKRYAVITQGTDETVVAIQGEDTVQTFPVHPISDSEIVDTTGAGDAFAGGFLAGIVLGKDVKTSVDMGQWLASWLIQESGAAYPSPKKEYPGSA